MSGAYWFWDQHNRMLRAHNGTAWHRWAVRWSWLGMTGWPGEREAEHRRTAERLMAQANAATEAVAHLGRVFENSATVAAQLGEAIGAAIAACDRVVADAMEATK